MTESRTPTVAAMGRVAVLAGGGSAERPISLKSGGECLRALQALGVAAEHFDPAERPLAELAGFDRAFIALHGRGGEDGVIQGALEALGVPYTGSGVLGSAIGMDKLRSKLVWKGLGLSTPEHRVPASAEALPEVIDALGLPLFVKPVREGSSLGTTRVDDAAALRTAWEAARRYDAEVLVEPCVVGEEYTVAVLDGEALPAIRIEAEGRFYDFEAKYQSEATRMVIPCGLAASEEAALGELALAAFDAIGASGWGRVDVMRDGAGRFWLLEVNTIPGMTDHSLVPAAARARGLDMAALVWRILLTSRRPGEG
ncbi:D-alanine--D-alanine ligase [Sediminicurvatus halobius]|uniref:D-alanine--D-alanine ligase n=1 Tax=Sediminicurvatus halobius TaxID=2182432 RepID=A0A2U2N7W4_9GAMM|nr:D-alanine--D-alanine ligase [Spiribacter halobius]PWG65172.1 D-alanine--D-alanine ligase [Spiribacter halobius]UEX78877.1 D-alanine--D-alanine ligase [Spiribacter halobius]